MDSYVLYCKDFNCTCRYILVKLLYQFKAVCKSIANLTQICKLYSKFNINKFALLNLSHCSKIKIDINIWSYIPEL
jgi:hypothetical protein